MTNNVTVCLACRIEGVDRCRFCMCGNDGVLVGLCKLLTATGSSTIPMETREQTEQNWPGLSLTYKAEQREDLVGSFNVKRILQKISCPPKAR